MIEMDIFTFAMDKEDAAEKNYRQLAEQANSEGLKHIFSFLADMEHRHLEVVAAMRDRADAPLEELSLDKMKAMFSRLAGEKDNLLDDQKTQVDIYRRARQMEQDSIELYTQQANKTEVEENRKIFGQLAEQEKMHYILVDNLIEFVMQPEVWCENAEFSHIIDKYRGTAFYPGMMEYEL